MTNKELAELMYPDIKMTIDDLEKKYPERDLPQGAIVSRYAPSPTGFVHMGNMLSCFIESFLPLRTNGVFFLRIEDTDQKREVENGIENIINSINTLGLKYNEGVISRTEQRGNYGPYIQSERKELYSIFAKYMIENDIAYPCFCTEEEIAAQREYQTERKLRIGYYGKYAKCRNLSNEERAERIKNNIPYTLRLKSTGNFENKIKFHDLVKGDVSFPENDQDIILLKSNGIPVYHFAHLVDDHLMHTTHVLRGEDWLSSVPIHIELFSKFHFKLPKYAHLGLVMIVDENGTKRKISKRKDQDFTVINYEQKGFPNIALQEYLMTIANTSFEEWRNANPNLPISNYDFSFKKVGSSPLFDYNKLVNISKNCISKMTNVELYENVYNWSKKYDEELNNILENNKDYALKVFNIERTIKKPRKDYVKYSDIKEMSWYMFDELYDSTTKTFEWDKISNVKNIKELLKEYFDSYYNINDNKDEWFNKMKEFAEKKGYCTDNKEYNANPDKYLGNITDIATVIRVAITTKKQSPDLYEILQVLGLSRINKRISYLDKL